MLRPGMTLVILNPGEMADICLHKNKLKCLANLMKQK